jgi:hypothetical protein
MGKEMAKENVKVFLEKIASDEALAKKLEAANAAILEKHLEKDATYTQSIEAMSAVATEAGLPFTIEEYNDYEHDYGDLSDDEMASVVDGGKVCVCVAGGGGKSSTFSGWKAKTCVCVLIGGGDLYKLNFTGKTNPPGPTASHDCNGSGLWCARCFCSAAGGGRNNYDIWGNKIF